MKKIKGIFCFKVKKGSDVGVWVVDVKNGKGSVKFDPNGKEYKTSPCKFTCMGLPVVTSIGLSIGGIKFYQIGLYTTTYMHTNFLNQIV